MRLLTLARRLVAGPFVAGAWLAAALAWAPVPAAAEEGFAFADREAFETAVRDYIMSNPEVVMDALQALEAREEEARQARRTAVLSGGGATIFNDPATPSVGNPEGDVTLVEFFDYRCGYCRGMAQELIDMVDADGQIRLVAMEFPILGPESLFAARAALAARKQGAYEEMHRALMLGPGQVTPASVLATAERLGLDVALLQSDMKAPEIDQAIRANHALAGQLDINGTPAFIIGKRIVPGAIAVETLKGLVEQQRAESG